MPSPGSARPSTSGTVRSVIAIRAGSSAVSTQPPSVVMPMGRTSYRERSMEPRTAPPVTTEMPCSELRPPKTTATRGLRGSVPGSGRAGFWGEFSLLISR